MHASVIDAKKIRDRENARRRHNILRRQAQGIVIACGLNPAITPSPSGKTHAERRVESRGERRMWRFFKNVVQVTLT
jgi:hypothetical protein